MVVFAVTLPQASQNSLVVTQPNSAAVHQQVAGWFTTQMASRGAACMLKRMSQLACSSKAPKVVSRRCAAILSKACCSFYYSVG